MEEAEVYLGNNRQFELNVRNGEVETIKQSTTKGIGLTVYKDKKLGFSYTSDLSSESLEEFIKKTVQLSLVADPKPWNGLPDFKQEKQKDLDLWDPSISEIENNTVHAWAIRLRYFQLDGDGSGWLGVIHFLKISFPEGHLLIPIGRLTFVIGISPAGLNIEQ